MDALHTACNAGDVVALSQLLPCQYVNATDRYGETALMKAVSFDDEDLAMEMTKLLLCSGADQYAGAVPVCFLIRHESVRRYLHHRHDYVTALHFFEEMDTEGLARRLGAGGAQLTARGGHETSRSSLQMARASKSENARLVCFAAQPYTRSSAPLWPLFARKRATQLTLLLRHLRQAELPPDIVEMVVTRSIGDRCAMENWKHALLSLRFVLALRLPKNDGHRALRGRRKGLDAHVAARV